MISSKPLAKGLYSRRFLSGARVLAALGHTPDATNEAKHRNALVPLLAHAVASAGMEHPISPEVIDTAVSVALSPVNEDRFTRLSALALAAQALALDSQFARLGSLSSLFSRLSRLFNVDRPFLAANLEAFASVTRGHADFARVELSRALGLDERFAIERIAKRTPVNICDVLLANGLHKWLIVGDLSRLEQARVVALKWGVAEAFELSELFLSYAKTAARSDLRNLVTQYSSAFQAVDLHRYLEKSRRKTLFQAQRTAIEGGVLEPEGCLLTLPTSCGKTFLAELRILAELERNPGKRVIYLAPYRMLARQVEQSLRQGLHSASRSVRNYGVDYDLNSAEQLMQEPVPDVAVMTPERLDSLLRLSDSQRRGSQEVKDYLASICLFVFDEIQVVGRSGRGPRLELFLLRLRNRFPTTPILALSGVIKGEQQIAEWLGSARVLSDGSRPTGTIELLWETSGDLYQWFDGSKIKVNNIPREKTAFKSASMLALRFDKAYHPVLLLETTRSYAEKAVKEVLDGDPRAGERFRADMPEQSLRQLDEAAEEAMSLLGDHPLVQLLRNGLAYHHAGLPSNLLRTIEELAENQLLRALATTTTVAEGAHLPFKAVIIPHLNFSGVTRRLEKDLYANIVGRAGRAGVAAEGIVVILDSDSKAFENYVERQLWKAETQPIRGRLGQLTFSSENLADFETSRQVQSQVVAWLGDQGSYVSDQATVLASKTLSWRTGSRFEQQQMTHNFGQIFQNLEERGLAVAASPYQLTELGQKARLAGLSPTSCVRINVSLRQSDILPLETVLANQNTLNEGLCETLARLIFEADETVEKSLWLRQYTNEGQKVAVLRQLIYGDLSWPFGDGLFEIDIQVLTQWMIGRSYAEIAAELPVMEEGPLAGEDIRQRISLVTEHVTRLSPTAGWVWSAVAALTPGQGQDIPSWIRKSVEFGVPSETCAEIIARSHVSRHGALLLHSVLSPDWNLGRGQIYDLDIHDPALGLTKSDHQRLQKWLDVFAATGF